MVLDEILEVRIHSAIRPDFFSTIGQAATPASPRTAFEFHPLVEAKREA